MNYIFRVILLYAFSVIIVPTFNKTAVGNMIRPSRIHVDFMQCISYSIVYYVYVDTAAVSCLHTCILNNIYCHE